MPTPPDFRHHRSGSLTIPPRNESASGMMASVAGANRFDGPRSPPNTSHVPCKFFRQGACQAGNACPFSHDIGASTENVCKYFAKGNCKFGPKCANIHVLPDGRRINYGKNGVTIGAPPINLGARVNPTTYHHPSNSALTNSFMRADNVPPYTATSPFGDDRFGQGARLSGVENGVPTIDTTYSSNPASVYGSPRDDDPTRFGLGLSPVNIKGLSILDAPLPASFDSNGISHAARYGPWPSSVPSKFGLDSPSPSLNAAKEIRNTDALKLLHQTAFGSEERLPPSAMGLDSNGFGSSPPIGSLPHGAGFGGDEYFGKRTMHSSSLRYSKPRLLSSSAPKVDRDWEAEFLFEEDYVPGALANEVLTPAEKARRGSNTNTLRGLDDIPSDPMPTSGIKFGSPGMVGSPGLASSPSRWGPLFKQQQRDEDVLDSGSSSLGASGRSMKHMGSAFGHVGSPLRNSSLATGIGSDLDSGIGRFSAISGPIGGEGESFSVLTQQLRRTKLGEESSVGSHPHLHPNAARVPSANGLGSIGAGVIGRDRDRERGLERHVSSGSIGSSVTGRFTTPIDEEDAAFVFNMEEEDDAQLRTRKRISGGPLGASSPLGAGWSYASAVAGQAAGSGAVDSAGGDAGVTEAVGGR